MALEESLRTTSLADVAETDAGLASGAYPIPETARRRHARREHQVRALDVGHPRM